MTPLYTLLYVLGGVWLLARLSLAHAARQVTVERVLSDERIFLGERLTVTLRLRNATGIPIPWLHFTESRPAAMAATPFSRVVALGPGETVETTYALDGIKRGRYLLGPLSFIAGDPFGFARVGELRTDGVTFTVYPRLSALPELGLPARLPMGDLATRRRLFEDPARATGTREYVPGDSLKRIHWNATARTGELMVKQYRHAMLLPCCVAVNLGRQDYDPKRFWMDSELAITAAASLCRHLVGEKQQVALMATGRDPDTAGANEPDAGGAAVRLPLRQGTAAVMAVLETMARVEPSEGQDFAATLLAEAQQMPWGTLFCVITPRETPEVAAVCARIARGGQQVLLFVTEGTVPARRDGYQVFPLSESRSGEVVLG